ncbi:hypothetical protein SAMN00120144_3573 [Hymenobacter roseosalivarius DSM 11622]|uniref:Uncharacterized protein n=1 Tax=Hymenobacter roseosalivarius DSM 11622 TaxID=645990 RepID=A0A1W1W252_9BACT|nr:hypothetical protein [Hymenobacter roseosalivarius]SMB99702.1 hypothetical protein SAMN00120144_3573 [Hymenobacter roseosalivarius DSM 11622]
MKRKMMLFGAAALLSGGVLFSFTSPTVTAANRSLKGTPDCPLVQNCAQVGTPACAADAPACCMAK